ncbi:MAG TPA: glycosyltransferase family 1 protein, partial [Candidatus Methylomirabilis sp.]|nr:glycosyltransferase family 1 protein [Candidatus Methylomirabilis sp.]
VRGAEAVVTISETAREEIARTFRIPPERVAVVYPWVKDAFFAGEGPPPARSPVAGEYLLYVGLRIAHKNLDGLVRAFLLVSGEFPTLKLVVAGKRYTAPDMVDRWKADPRLAGRLVEILDPPDETLRALYAGARAFVFPSLAEGFGLPPLEAMASGVPVVCSDIPVFREVYGDAVRYADPNLPESIADGVRKVLSDPGLTSRLARSGSERAALYRRDRAVNAYLELIRSA